MTIVPRTLLPARTAALLLASLAAAHPGSGIVADGRGQIYFMDTGEGVWELDAHSALTRLPGPRFDWMTIDPENRPGREEHDPRDRRSELAFLR